MPGRAGGATGRCRRPPHRVVGAACGGEAVSRSKPAQATPDGGPSPGGGTVDPTPAEFLRAVDAELERGASAREMARRKAREADRHGVFRQFVTLLRQYDPGAADDVLLDHVLEHRRDGPPIGQTGWAEQPEIPGPPDPAPLPLDALPAVLRDWVASVADSVQVDPSLPAVLSLASTSAATAGKAYVRVDGAWDFEWIPLYAAAVAEPGERKSPAYRKMTEPLRRWEVEAQREAAPRQRAAEEAAEVAERRLKDAKKAAARGDIELREVEALGIQAEEARSRVPALPQLLASDATPEALVRQMAKQGGRVAVFSPEGGPLRILDGRYSEGAARLEELAQAYDGEELRLSRISRDGGHVRRPALTLCVAIQPCVLDTIRNSRSMRGQGIYGRITWLAPRSLLGERVDSSRVPPLDRDAERRYEAALRRLLAWKPKDVEEDNTPVPHVVRLSEGAAEVKGAYHRELEPQMAPGGRLHPIRDWSSKTVGRAVRIAALLELAARAGDSRPLAGEPISRWAMESAVRLCRALTSHARSVFADMERDGEAADLRYLLKRLRELPEGSTLRDLHRAVQGRSSIEGADDVDDLVAELEMRGCLRREHPGRRPSPTLELHPSLRRDIDRDDGGGRSGGYDGEEPGSVNSVNADAETPPDPEGDSSIPPAGPTGAPGEADAEAEMEVEI